MNLIDGKKIADGIFKELKKEIEEKKLKPYLGVVLVGSDPASQIYVQKKEEAAQKVGIQVRKSILPQNTSEEEILKIIEEFNQDKEVNGILVQLPLPQGISKDRIIQSISPDKDVDGFLKESRFDSPFILAIGKALEATEENLKNKKAVALVNSDAFGEKLKLKLEPCVKSIRAIRWSDAFGYRIAEYDIIISALGQPEVIKGSMIKSGVILIDGGISKKDGKMVGDVDRESVQEKVNWLSPVPGGLGPMTVAFLLRNVVISER